MLHCKLSITVYRDDQCTLFSDAPLDTGVSSDALLYTVCHCAAECHCTLSSEHCTLPITVQWSITAHWPSLCSGASLCNVQWTLSTVQWWRITVQWRSIPVHCSATLQCAVERHCTQSSDAPVYSVNDSTASGLTSPQQIKIKKTKIRSRLPFKEICVLTRTSLRKGRKGRFATFFVCMVDRISVVTFPVRFQKIIGDSLPLKKKRKRKMVLLLSISILWETIWCLNSTQLNGPIGEWTL